MSAWSLSRTRKPSVACNVSSRFFRSCFQVPSTSTTPAPVDTTILNSPTTLQVPDSLRIPELDDLSYALHENQRPSRVWSYYTRLLNSFASEALPVELHRQVLRKCTPSVESFRTPPVQHSISRVLAYKFHIHEGRFQTVIRAIRALGEIPDLGDYHFILGQFAAVGHYIGTIRVYKELKSLGLEPTSETLTLCFSSVAHRLALPILEVERRLLIIQTKEITADLLRDMQKYHVPLTSINLDLCIRIMKETLDCHNFDALMKWGYGVDLSNPDRAPLEYIGIGARNAQLSGNNISVPPLLEPLPFSTAALNTTIDMLGRFGDVSKLVQAFEILTQPLPQANRYFFSTFDDDDDFGIPVPQSPAFTPPHATPNTTTYSILIRHLCQAGHAVLARHYLLLVMELEKKMSINLKNLIPRIPMRRIPAPHVAINRGTLIPVFGESNRDKNLGLMRWLNGKLPKIIKRKQADLTYYREFREVWRHTIRLRNEMDTIHADGIAIAIAHASSQASTSGSVSHEPRIQQNSTSEAQLHTASNFNSNKKRPPFASPPDSSPKSFDLDLHIRILERDVEEIQDLAERVDEVVGRTTQRVKERLGRRVWAKKNIYFLTDNTRLPVSRSTWKEIVNFKPQRRSGAYETFSGSSRPRHQATNKLHLNLRLYRLPRKLARDYSTLARPPGIAVAIPISSESRTADILPGNLKRGYSPWSYLSSFIWR
ncbi:hypothetical protein AMATHDRAFT_2063 [Amanita thiersii Skay4041]|uniref:Uncharacterized protein n=1 Tax=Amanita thiersii Skay4041 TaxID=703135 RepID=A0A2A9NWE6_9AGAR|nr:hypothetical protein AMATHDRAFT_2063 [Amanita thiersii Skay4041]